MIKLSKDEVIKLRLFVDIFGKDETYLRVLEATTKLNSEVLRQMQMDTENPMLFEALSTMFIELEKLIIAMGYDWKENELMDVIKYKLRVYNESWSKSDHP
jgi:hypothetical protein